MNASCSRTPAGYLKCSTIIRVRGFSIRHQWIFLRKFLVIVQKQSWLTKSWITDCSNIYIKHTQNNLFNVCEYQLTSKSIPITNTTRIVCRRMPSWCRRKDAMIKAYLWLPATLTILVQNRQEMSKRQFLKSNVTCCLLISWDVTLPCSLYLYLDFRNLCIY